MVPSRSRIALGAAVLLAAAAVAGNAPAQPLPKGKGQPAGASAGDSAKGSGKGDPAAKADPAKLQEAKKHMEAGAAFYNDPNGHKCEEAYREFKMAYELSGSLNALKAMGICALELERDGEAIERLEAYLAGKGDKIEASDKAQIESDLKALKAGVARVKLRSDRPSFRVTDVRTPSKGAQVTNDYAVEGEQTLGIHPGRHTFTATSEGAPPVTWTVEIANGSEHEHVFEFAKAADKPPDRPATPPAMERPVPVTVFVFGGLTVALAVPTAILMVRASGKNSDYEAQNGTLPAAALEQQRSDVKGANLVADIFLGATVASLAATGVFYFTRPSRPASTPGTGWQLTPVVGRSGGGAALVGTF
jgi:hypothetical protein